MPRVTSGRAVASPEVHRAARTRIPATRRGYRLERRGNPQSYSTYPGQLEHARSFSPPVNQSQGERAAASTAATLS